MYAELLPRVDSAIVHDHEPSSMNGRSASGGRRRSRCRTGRSARRPAGGGTRSTRAGTRPPSGRSRRRRGTASRLPAGIAISIALTESIREAAVDFNPSPRTEELREQLLAFMDEHVYPAEAVYQQQYEESGDLFFHPPVMEELKVEARKLGPLEPVPAGRAVRRRASRTSSTRRWPRSRAAASSPPRRSTAPRPTPATWRSWPSSAPPSSRRTGSSRCSRARSAPASR